RLGAMEFVLPRPPSVALREYVPGNLIYANGNRFVARRFHRDIDEQRQEVPFFEVSTQRQAVKPTNLGSTPSSLGVTVVPAIAVCDVDLVHQSHISDEEELRFQMGVAVYGIERDQHNGGRAYRWGEQALHHCRGVRLRLVNVGSSLAIDRFDRFGYPVCTVCGQSVSPLSSDKQREHFEQSHLERCGRPVTPVGFYADVVADALSLPACPDQATAYSVIEALRIGATRVLDMHMEDLQILVIGHVDRDEVDGLLWDPMPGGSGLLDQLCARFDEVVAVAREVVEGCPSACATSCIDCLQSFRNGYYHKHLQRSLAQERLQAWGTSLSVSHGIPAKHPSQEPADGSHPVNEAERRLRHLLLAAGFEEGIRGQQLHLDRAIGTTTPDVIYRAAGHGDDEGVCIYLDGLSRHIHGNPATAEQDQRIRSWLRNHGWEVIEIAANDLADEDAMVRHFRKLAGYLNDSALRERLRGDRTWFVSDVEATDRSSRPRLRVVRPTDAAKYVSCVPLVPLRAAAGFFSDPRRVEEPEADWVEVETSHKLRPGMFVTQVCGESMQPLIPDGSYCLFASPIGGKAGESLSGTRQGQTVLVELKGGVDPETGHRFTVKRYESEKVTEPDGTWRHTRITLRPLNHQFESIIVENANEDELSVVATFLEVL
ncbi:MAG TPA: DUF1998 domain-containing protein, partial [Thermoanaerobaculaceae bacterium]|nr:DUF1998 domain-containing protein [Thermoanaerobaculaceae bacterium]